MDPGPLHIPLPSPVLGIAVICDVNFLGSGFMTKTGTCR